MNVVAIGETSKSDDEGKVQVALKILASGRDAALALASLGGKQVEVYRQSGELIDVGILRSATQKKRTKEEDGEIDGTAKVVGSRAFQKCVGLMVRIVEAKVQPSQRQPALPEMETPKPSSTVCADCGHPWNNTKNPKRDQDGHGRKSGECYVVGCKCEAFMPAAVKG